jgi:uncharacterized iron-regulated membrane protein
MPAPDRRRTKSQDDMVDWFTVSYRSIMIAILLLVVLGGGVGFYFWTRNAPVAPAAAEPTSR